MDKNRFEEIEKRNQNNLMQTCYEVFCEEKRKIPLDQFNQVFAIWLNMFKDGDIKGAIEYFKNNKVK